MDQIEKLDDLEKYLGEIFSGDLRLCCLDLPVLK